MTHGTVTGYVTHGCRCGPCCLIQSRWQAQYRAQRFGTKPQELGDGHYCGRCKRCRELDAWLAKPDKRMRQPVTVKRPDLPSWRIVWEVLADLTYINRALGGPRPLIPTQVLMSAESSHNPFPVVDL